MKKRPVCLTIAGFDPSSGAGLLADIKTFEQFRVQGLAVQTANTVQTEDAFEACNWMSDETIIRQLNVLVSRYRPAFFKIGLIENSAVLLSVLQAIHASCERPFIVWDPVLAASAGGNFDTHRFEQGLEEILSLVSVVTPNLPEYRLLFGDSNPEDIAAKYAMGIYLKGGHSETAPGKDFYYVANKLYPFNPINRDTHRKISEKHGSGCVLSAALLAVNALGYPVVKGALKAKGYTERFLASGITKLGAHT